MLQQFKNYIQKQLDLTENQVNLLFLGALTTIFQGIIYNFIDHNSFSKRYFILTIIMSLIYNLFYFKTYVNADNSKKNKIKNNKIKNNKINNDNDSIDNISLNTHEKELVIKLYEKINKSK